ADYRRRRLWRWLEHYAGAFARIRHEVADVAARSEAKPAIHRPRRRTRIRAIRSNAHSRHARVADSSLPRPRALYCQGQCTAKVHFESGDAKSRSRRQPDRVAPGELPARAGENSPALAGCAEIYSREGTE